MPSSSPVAALPGTDAHVLSAPDGSIVLRLSSGRFLRLQDPPPNLLEFSADHSRGTDQTVEYVRILRDTIASRQADETEERWPSNRRTVGLVGEGPVIKCVADALEGWDVRLRRFGTAQQLLKDRERRLQTAGTDCSLVIAYADAPRERAAWARMDALPQSGCAWLRAYREGQICFVDPLSVDGEDPGSDQVLRRRLAAHPTPRLLARWRDADAPAEPLTIAVRTLLAGRLLRVALAWAEAGEDTGPLRSTLWQFVPATGRITEHTVLGYDTPYVPTETVVHQ